MLYLWAASAANIFADVVGPIIKDEKIETKIIQLESGFPVATEGDVVLAFGQKSVEKLQAIGLVPKNRKVGALRETVFKLATGGKMLVTFDPGLTQIEYERKPDIQWDVKLACRLAKTGSVDAPIGKYRYVQDFTDAINFIEEQYAKTGQAVPHGCDLETMGFDSIPEENRIVSISITYKESQADVIRFKKPEDQPTPPPPFETDQETPQQKLWKQIHFLMNSPKVKVRGANFKFDMGWMGRKWQMTFDSYAFDTTLIGSLLDENRSNSLEMHAKINTPIGGYDHMMNTKYDKGHMELVPDDDLLTYAGGDTDATYRVAEVFKQQLLQDKKLANFYVRLVHPAAKVFAKIEQRGMLVDVKEYQKLESEVTIEVARLEKEIFSLIPRKLRLKYADNLSLTRDVILREFMFTPHGLNLKPRMLTDKTKEPSCSMGHFEMFQDVPEAKKFVELLSEYNSATKTLTTYIGRKNEDGKYVKGFLQHLRADGRFHPSYMLFKGAYGNDEDSGTDTGRTSCKDPAYQTIPKHTKWAKPLRRVYVPPPGHVILKLDFSQGELRITACVANEPTMIMAYKNDMDLHSITAAELVGNTLEEFMLLPDGEREELRYGGKAGNFGLIYGMGAEGFMNYARVSYGVILTLAQAIEFREKFFRLYKGLVDWHDTYKKLARKYGYVRSPLGRIRHLPLINAKNGEVRSKQERRAINSPIQSCLSDLMQLAMVEIDRRYPNLWVFGMTHDDLAIYVPEDGVEIWAQRLKSIMENLPIKQYFGWEPQLMFKVDAECGPNMADVKKIKNLK